MAATDTPTWKVSSVASEFRIAYGSGADSPQYAALHLDSSYFRMVPSANSGWGTSVILMPALRTNHQYLQGAPVACTSAVRGEDLVLTLTGTIATLQVTALARLHPPHDGFFVADITVSTSGDVPLDVTPGETFKPVMLSSMHESPTAWDAHSAYTTQGGAVLPLSGWILPSPVTARTLGLRGGDSAWKTGAPTIEVNFITPSSLAVTGWVTSSQDPNDDNVGFWANSDTLLSSWSYQLVAKTDANTPLTPPAFLESPASASVAAGEPAAFTAPAAGVPTPTFAWQLSTDRGATWSTLGEDALHSGTATDTLHLSATSAAFDSHRYRCVAINSAGSTFSPAALLSLTPSIARLVNLSSRAYCRDGDRVAIGGFVLVGDVPKRVLLRAVGPTLTTQGLASAEVLSDPMIELHHGSSIIARNDNWPDAPNVAEITSLAIQLGASPLAASDRTSSALLLTLAPGVYSFVAHGAAGSTGIVLLEIYDADPADPRSRFANLSTRADCGSGDAVAIGGLVLAGTGTKHVLLRAVGPTLASQGLAASAVLSDPAIEVHHGGAIIAANRDASDDVDASALATTGARVGATPLALADLNSAAVLLTLPTGPTSFIVTGQAAPTGIILVEIYDAD